jgi:hypothetical protein
MGATRAVGMALLLVACATPGGLSPEQETRLRAAANKCQQEHPVVLRYEIDRFGTLEAWAMDRQSQAELFEPFFACVRGRLRDP